jgi:predicted CoA-binding protein
MRTIEQILTSAKTMAVVGMSNKPERASYEVANTCSPRATRSCP